MTTTTTSTALAARMRNVSVQFPRSSVPALTDVSFDIAADESVLLLGTSGSGKSTVLRTIAGVVPATVDADVRGEITLGESRGSGDDGDSSPARPSVVELAEQLAYVQQNPLDQLCMPTVRDELAFGLENQRTPRAQMDARIERVLNQVGASHLADRATGSLSGGEGQRVAIAGALIRQPRLLLLDEPTAMLDPAAARQIGALLARLRNGPTGSSGPGSDKVFNSGDHSASSSHPGSGSLLVEHRLDEIGALPETTMILTPDGSVLAHGATGQVLTEHAVVLEEMGCWLPLGLRLKMLNTTTGAAPSESIESALTGLAQRVLRGAYETGMGASLSAGAGGGGRTPEVVLTARNLTVHAADGNLLLADADLTLRRGRITAVIGRNGSGKSTLLRTLAGLTDATGVLDCGAVGLVFQHPEHQFLTRSVRAEVGYGPTRARETDVDQRVTTVLADFGLTELAEQDPFRLSGGQQRRLSLATMAIGSDDVLLFDEPTFGQDRAHAAAITSQLVRLAESGRAVVVVTHDLNVVARIADDVVVLDSGRILAAGEPEHVLRDQSVMSGAGLTLPPVLAWCAANDVPMQPIAQALR